MLHQREDKPELALQLLKRIRTTFGDALTTQQKELYRHSVASLAFEVGQYEDVISIAASTLHRASNNEPQNERNYSLIVLVAHAFKKAGDTTRAIAWYEYLTKSPIVPIRKDASANLVTLYHLRHRHAEAYAVAAALESLETQMPNDVSAQANREYYRGRSAFFLGHIPEARTRMMRAIGVITGERSFLGASEIRVRIGMARYILNDSRIHLRVGLNARSIYHTLSAMILEDSTQLNLRYKGHVRSHLPNGIPADVYLPDDRTASVIERSKMDARLITGKVTDSHGIEWYSTVLGLYIRLGSNLLRAPIHAKALSSIAIEHDTLVIGSYAGVSYRQVIKDIVANWSPLQQTLAMVPLPYNLPSIGGCVVILEPSKTLVAFNDTANALYKTVTAACSIGRGLVLLGTDVGPFVIDVGRDTVASSQQLPPPSPLPLPSEITVRDTIVSLAVTDDSVVIFTSKAAFIASSESVRSGAPKYRLFNVSSFLSSKFRSSPIASTLLSTLLGKIITDALPRVNTATSSLPRFYVMGDSVAIVVDGRALVAASWKTNRYRVLPLPEPMHSQLESGYRVSILSDSTVLIHTRDTTLAISIPLLFASPPTPYVVAVHDPLQFRTTFCASGFAADVDTEGDSVKVYYGAGPQRNIYNTGMNVVRVWDADTTLYDGTEAISIQLPSESKVVCELQAPGDTQKTTLVFRRHLPIWRYRYVQVGAGVITAIGIAGALIMLRRRRQRHLGTMLYNQRDQIARDLHDTVGADLARLARGPEQGAVASTTRTFRGLLWLWSEEALTLDALLAQIAENVQQTAEYVGLHTDVTLPERVSALPVSAKTSKNVFLIVNEIMANVVKHAQAKRVQFTVDVQGTSVAITIGDDGMGFDTTTASTGRGRRNIETRARESNIDVSVSSSQAAGTTYTLTFNVA